MGYVQIGMRERWGVPGFFGLDGPDRGQHLYLIGKSGSGKSTAMHSLAVQDIEAGRGLCFIDPHGDEAERLLDAVPPWRTDDLVYFDAAEVEYPLGLNLLEAVEPAKRPLVAGNVVSIFEHLWADNWGPRSEYILLNTVAALLEFPIRKGGATLLGVPRMFSDEDYRARVLAYVTDPLVLAFWKDEFEAWPDRLRAEAVAPLQNKAGRLLRAPLRNILGQVRSSIRPRDMMDRQRVVIVNLAKGKISEGDANMLGSLLVTAFELAAAARADVPEDERVPFYLYVDEFHSFTTNSFAGSLSYSRKYRLCLALAHQYLQQLSDDVREAVLGNAGSVLCFRVGGDDADLLAREFDPYSATTLRELGRGEVCARLLEDGEVREPFLGKTLPPQRRDYGARENLLNQSRMRYGTPRSEVERKLAKWWGGGRR